MSATDSINALDSSLSASIDVSKPFLPPELERKIFELAFTFDNPVAIANRRLILVAKRVYAWLRPELYRIFFQTRGPLKRYQLYPDLRECPDDVDQKGICQYARCLFVDYTIPTSEASDLLTMCTNVENFAFWALAGLDFLWSTLSQFTNLRRLAGYMQKLTIQQLSETAFAHQLTHLELIRPGSSLQLDTGVFSDLPRLSHLALWPGDVDYQVFARALQSCEALRVLIQYTELIRVISGIDNSVATLQTMYAAELRMAVIYNLTRSIGDWLVEARDGYDMWRYAEDIIFARKMNYFKSDKYQEIPFSNTFPWEDHLTEEGLVWFNKTPELLLRDAI